jgi:hypothetical protein
VVLLYFEGNYFNFTTGNQLFAVQKAIIILFMAAPALQAGAFCYNSSNVKIG